MNSGDTIAAISTPPGKGGIGIVRLSGNQAVGIADSLFRPAAGVRLSDSPTHTIHYGHIIDPSSGEIADEVLVTVMKAPRTYTREDTVEVNCHGGPLTLRRVLHLLLAEGARLADPGEFTRRAFLNGRIDLSQAEAVADVINAMTDQAGKCAMEQLKGSLSRRIMDLREEIVGLTAYVEAHIDFPEEDMETADLGEMRRRSAEIIDKLQNLVEGSKEGIILREGVRTAIIGVPNVGKSSLLNILLQKDRAIVTDIAGTTRDVIEEYLNIKGIPVRIMDTAGIRDVGNEAELQGVSRSMSAMRSAGLVLLVLDGSRELTNDEEQMLSACNPRETIIVINKSDLKRRLKFDSGDVHHVEVSAKTGDNIDTLKDMIAKQVLHGASECPPDIITNVRHADALERALSSMDHFSEALNRGTSPEFLAVDLREALQSLAEIVGMITADEILDRIFSTFCIGK